MKRMRKTVNTEVNNEIDMDQDINEVVSIEESQEDSPNVVLQNKIMAENETDVGAAYCRNENDVEIGDGLCNNIDDSDLPTETKVQCENNETEQTNTPATSNNQHVCSKCGNRCAITDNPPQKFRFSIESYMDDDTAIHFYTGLQTYQKLSFVYTTLGDAVNHLDYIYGTKPTLDPLNQFFLTLIILRQNKTHYELSLQFGITLKEVSNIFITWVKFMKLQWAEIPQWPSKELVHFFTPHDFRNKFRGTRGIMDGTEIPIEKPSIPTAQQSTFSTYKNKSTIKTVVYASPAGLTTYVSPAYGGSTSDRQVIERSNLVNMCDPGDSIMADKGFDIQDILAAYRILLNIPHFFKKRNQLSGQTIIEDKKISSKRVNIERVIGLAKTYKILRGPLRNSEIKLADEIIFICFMLSNFRKPIVGPNA